MYYKIIINGAIGMFLGAFLGQIISIALGSHDPAPLRIILGIVGATVAVIRTAKNTPW